MKFQLFLSFVAVCPLLVAQQGAPGSAPFNGTNTDPSTVVATLNGKKFTAGQLEMIVRNVPSAFQQVFLRDPKRFLADHALLQALTIAAEQKKIDQKSPYREQIEFARLNVLSNAYLNEHMLNFLVTPEDQKKYYAEHPDEFRQAMVKMIQIPFGVPPAPGAADPNARKVLSEEEARALADKLVRQARGAADFVKLAKEYSGDPGSVARDGDYGEPITAKSAVPEPIKAAIFALSAGQVSDPVRLENGFYIFRLEKYLVQPFDSVKDDIFKNLKNAEYQRELKRVRGESSVKIENEEYFENLKKLQPGAAPALK